MFSRSNLIIVAVAILGACLGLVIGGRFPRPPLAATPAPPGVTVLRPGDTRVDLALPGLNGGQHRLSDWNGKLVLLNFWASWCGPCREEMPLLDRVGKHLAGQGFTVIGVAIDNTDAVKTFLKKHPVDYPILLGEANAVDPSVVFGDRQGVLPYSVLIGRNGTILAQRAGSFTATTLTNWLQAHMGTEPPG